LLLLGRAIREVREEQGFSVGELAGATGVARKRIAAVEDGRFDPEYDLLIALAEGIGVRPSAFFVRAEVLCRG
jgi:transcriptional regulator with XRE-family HTH domain